MCSKAGKGIPQSHYSLHCRECTDSKGCGKLHVYVVELDREKALKNKKFLEKNPHIDESFTGKCYYVGESAHNPECRYKGHAGKRKRYFCKCMKEPKYRLKKDGNKKSRVTGPGLCRCLRPDLYKNENPVAKAGKVGQEKAKIAEGELARRLIREGHAAYSDRL